MDAERVAGRYRLEREIGRGAMGTVWRAWDEQAGVAVALKLMNAEAAQHPEARARFEREAALVSRLSSPHVVALIDHGLSPAGLPFLVMELLEGPTLRDRLVSCRRLDLRHTARVIHQAAAGLGVAHAAGLVHRDLKPENLLLAGHEGEGERVVILDFGTAKASDALARGGLDPTKTGALLGTPYYMSPEQAQGLKSVDHRTDLWALGVVAYECLTGVRPFTAPALGPLVAKILMGAIVRPSALDAHLPPALDDWMAQALARPVEVRFASAESLAAAFDALL